MSFNIPVTTVLPSDPLSVPVTTTSISSSPDAPTIVNATVGATEILIGPTGSNIGSSSTDSYTLPSGSSTEGTVLTMGALGVTKWSSLSGVSVTNGGDTVPLTLGTLSGTDDLKIVSAGDIILDSGIRYKFEQITSGQSYQLTPNNYIISITGADNINADFIVNLPEIIDGSGGNRGRQYIISKDYGGTGKLIIQAFAGETIDDDNVFILDTIRQRIRLTSTGDSTWLVI